MTSQIEVRTACGRGAAVSYLFHGLVWVCEIELSHILTHMGKNNGNPDLLCDKNYILLKIL